MEPVKALVCKTNDEFFDRQGDLAVDTKGIVSLEKAGYILCECPCGCGGSMNLPVYREGEPKPAKNAWLLSGTPEAPSLAPSIRDLSGCRFHGHLTDGVWTFCGDSGVKPPEE